MDADGDDEHIKVCARFRPLNSREVKAGGAGVGAASGFGMTPWSWDRQEVTAQFPVTRGERARARAVERYGETSGAGAGAGADPSNASAFLLDRVFGPDESNERLYEEIVADLVVSAMEGKHAAAFAYGQTGTGKTYTMQGTSEHAGVIPRAIHDVFAYIAHRSDREFLLRVSYLEVYNESINDLFEPSSTNLKVLEDPRLGSRVQNLEEKIVVAPEQVFALLSAGEAQRHIGSTNFNAQSSRSHTILRLVVESKEKELADAQEPGRSQGLPQGQPPRGAAARVATLNLVDLAGSESAGASESRERRQEGSNINRSLLTLTHVIAKLGEQASMMRAGSDNSASLQHIPYRDSKLTRILRLALQGNSRISIVCTCTPWGGMADETLNTLRFASRAKKVRRSVRVNEVVDDRALLLKYKQEIMELRLKLAEAERKSAEHATLQQSELLTRHQQQQQQQQPPTIMAEQIARDQKLKEQIDEAIRNLNRVILNSGAQVAHEEELDGDGDAYGGVNDTSGTTDASSVGALSNGELGVPPSPLVRATSNLSGVLDNSTPFFRKLSAVDHSLDRFDRKPLLGLERRQSMPPSPHMARQLADARARTLSLGSSASSEVAPASASLHARARSADGADELVLSPARAPRADSGTPASATSATPAGKKRVVSIASDLRSIREHLSSLLQEASQSPSLLRDAASPALVAYSAEGGAVGATAAGEAAGAAYTRELEARVRELEEQIIKSNLERSVTKADQSFLEKLLADKDRTIREWTDAIADIEARQQVLEDENERLRRLVATASKAAPALTAATATATSAAAGDAGATPAPASSPAPVSPPAPARPTGIGRPKPRTAT